MEEDATSNQGQKALEEWSMAIRKLATLPVYIKLSGGFSEIGNQDPAQPWKVETIADRMWPWFITVLKCFGPERIMFGSDWPVCNVRGPGDELSWSHWRDVVAELLARSNLDSRARNLIWAANAVKAYHLDRE
jgi:L-rhamnono-1,4-lactonase